MFQLWAQPLVRSGFWGAFSIDELGRRELSTISRLHEPFGNTTVTSGSSANPYQYTGRENDGTGVYFYRGRYYSPTLQRFISEDPIGMSGGIDLYAYAGNNPISFRDPFGTDKKKNTPWQPNWFQCRAIDIIIPGVSCTWNNGPNIQNWPPDAPPHVYGGGVGGLQAGGGTQTGYRAVSPAEYQDIVNTGQFNPSPVGSEVKYFYPTQQQAADFGDRMYGPGNYQVVQGEFPTGSATSINPATEGPAFTIPNEDLPLGDVILPE